MNQITAKQYAKIHPCLQVQRGNVQISNITFINAVLYVLENGCTWHALLERFGTLYTVYARFRRWSRGGWNMETHMGVSHDSSVSRL